MHAPGIPHVLDHPECRLDFSALAEVHCARSMGPKTESLFSKGRQTITSLQFGGTDETMESLDLGLFPVLTHIRCDNMGPVLAPILASLLPRNVVAEICLVLFAEDVGTVDLQPFESSILAAELPELQRVVVEVNSRLDFLRASEEGMVQALTADLPLLRQRSLLSVHFKYSQ